MTQHTSADHFFYPRRRGQSSSDQACSASNSFKRLGGWSAEEVARLHHDDPCLLEDQYLAGWRRTILHTAGKYARKFINRAFPENQLYLFCKLPQWPSALPWIAAPRDHASKEAPVPGRSAGALQAAPVSCGNPPLVHDCTAAPTTCTGPQLHTLAATPGNYLKHSGP